MGRTIAQIQADIIAKKNADTVLAGLTSASDTAVWRLWTYIVAFCMYVVEGYYDQHKAEVDTAISNGVVGSLKWYSQKARAYQDGVALVDGTDYYATTEDATFLVEKAAAVELTDRIRIKVAKKSGGALTALSGDELGRFATYMGRVKFAGVRVSCTSAAGDNLRLKVIVDYDALVLNGNGERVDGTELTPVKDAIAAYLIDMGNNDFNGMLVLNRLIDAIVPVNGVGGVEGVKNLTILYAEANYAATAYVPIVKEYNPDAGYLVHDVTYFDTWVQYMAHE